MTGFHHPSADDHHHNGESDHGHTHSHGHAYSHGHGHTHAHGHAESKATGTRWGLRSRRAFLGDFGRSTLAMAVFTPIVAACSSDDSTADGDATDTSGAGGDAEETDGDATTTSAEPLEDDQGSGEALRWGRTNLGFVSAYVLARGNTAAIVDTGTAGSEEAIGQTLADMGLTYADVGHVILTHHHGDHVGSIDGVLGQATSAMVHVGEADLGQVNVTAGGSPVDDARIQALTGGEDIFGFEALATPGHTAGHIAAIDHTAGLLVAGDAIFTEGDSAVEGPERFFADVEQSRQSIIEMAALTFNTLLVGHGEPIEDGADAAVAALAASLG